MGIKNTASSVKDIIWERLASNSKLLGDLSTLLAFAATASSGQPLSLLAGLALIAQASGAAISAGVEVSKRIFLASEEKPLTTFSNYEQFQVLFYTTCFRCYIEAIPNVIEEIKKLEVPIIIENQKRDQMQELKEAIDKQIGEIEGAEVDFLFCVEPLESEVLLFEALNKWLISTLSYYGFNDYKIRQLVTECGKEARRRFHSYLAQDLPEATWMRNYLAFAKQDDVSKKILDGLQSLQIVLKEWTDSSTELKERQEKAWIEYRDVLRNLPDQKESMYNEEFGVRKVFLQPRATYHIIGASGEAGKPKQVPDLGRLFGALISSRITGEDLIILCGGPGSGKSTLCRILSGELAKDKGMYPVFLRLRRLKEGSDIALFVEETLQKQGVIDHYADLRELNNLVLILDGFDELVMASRSRLRHFFNVLREEHTTGSLRKAKIIVSGRDTLFPQGEGLPHGSHVINLLPFDAERVKMWGEKWRKLHKSGPGHNFRPETLIDTGKGKTHKISPIHHLITWPLTLHLVARVYTRGGLNIGIKQSNEIEKAYLYRSILSETANRQGDQAEGKGRLNPKDMREFLRSLAWAMYSKSTDSMDLFEVVPLLTKYFPNSGEGELADLADVAIVNSPELTKGEETGFEFVHKSFSEYLLAEHIALCIEKIIFKAPEFGSDILTWRMANQEAASELAPIIGIRLITDEVLEMLEPMVGSLVPFLKNDKVDMVVSADIRRDGLHNTIDRFERLYCDLIQGKYLEIINQQTHNKLLITNPLEAYANYCAGLVLIGTSAVRQLPKEKDKKQQRLFNIDPLPGSFWRFLCLLHVGGINIDQRLSQRLFKGLEIKKSGQGGSVGDFNIPINLSQLSVIEGYSSFIGGVLSELINSTIALRIIQVFLLAYASENIDSRENEYFYSRSRYYHSSHELERSVSILADAGFMGEGDYSYYEMYSERIRMDLDRMMHMLRFGDKDSIRRFSGDLLQLFHRYSKIFDQRDEYTPMVRFLERLFVERENRYRSPQPKSDPKAKE